MRKTLCNLTAINGWLSFGCVVRTLLVDLSFPFCFHNFSITFCVVAFHRLQSSALQIPLYHFMSLMTTFRNTEEITLWLLFEQMPWRAWLVVQDFMCRWIACRFFSSFAFSIPQHDFIQALCNDFRSWKRSQRGVQCLPVQLAANNLWLWAVLDIWSRIMA